MALVFNLNQTPANWVGCMMQLWQTMVNAGWTVLSWSDGTTVSGAPGAGFLGFATNSLGIPNSTAGQAGSANNSLAWILLQQPSGSVVEPYRGIRQFTMQLSTGATRTNWRIKYSMSGGYTDPSAAGTATRTPSINATVNDELIHIGGGTDASPTFGVMFSNGGTTYEGITRCHSIADNGMGPTGSQPSIPYGFINFGPVQGGLTSGLNVANPVNFIFMFDPMEQGTAAPSDLDPFAAYAEASGAPFQALIAGNPYWTHAAAGGTGTGFPIRGWMRRGQTNQASTTWQALIPASVNATNMVNKFGGNHVTGNDDLCPIIYTRNSADGGHTGYKGISAFVRWNGTNRQTSDTLSTHPSGSTRDRIVAGHCNIPWDGSTVPVI